MNCRYTIFLLNETQNCFKFYDKGKLCSASYARARVSNKGYKHKNAPSQ